MTEQEAKYCMQGKLDCMNKCDVFDCKGTDECDSCNFCYAQGTFGEQKEALKMAIQALEKQMPYKPEVYEDRYYGCKCGNILLHKWLKYPTELMPKSEGLPYCLACGQKLDWSEEQERIW